MAGEARVLAPKHFRAFIFDMDGLLAETESLWRQAETEVARGLGIELSERDLNATMGPRVDRGANVVRVGREPSARRCSLG